MKTKLYRSRTDTMVAGVCGGLGSYLGIDPVLIRLFFVLLTISGGAGVLLYVVLWVVIPLEGGGEVASAETIKAGADEIAARAELIGSDVDSAVRSPHPQAALLIGVSLMLLGVVYLLRNLGVPWAGWLSLGTLWPLLLIGGGIALMVRRGQGVTP